MKLPVYDLQNNIVDEIEIPQFLIDYPFNEALIHQVWRWHLQKTHYPWAHTKTRAEVRGGGKKPWSQKGTGRARHGSIRSPIWRGGGVTFGPRNEKKYAFKIPKKMRLNALKSLLAQKIKEGEVKIFNKFEFAKKTKEIAKFLKNLIDKKSVVLAFASNNKDLLKYCRNIEKVFATEGRNLNLKDILTHKYLFIELPAWESLISRLEKTSKK